VPSDVPLVWALVGSLPCGAICREFVVVFAVRQKFARGLFAQFAVGIDGTFAVNHSVPCVPCRYVVSLNVAVR
jgi:hypothetical protein